MKTPKPFDIVQVPDGGIAVVTEVGDEGRCSLDYLKKQPKGLKAQYNAWWDPEDLQLLDSLTRILANAMAHPCGVNREQGDRDFSLNGR